MASTISMMAILVIGTLLVQDGSLSLGDVIAFIGFANLLIGRLDQMKAFATRFSKRAPSWKTSSRWKIPSATAKSLPMPAS